jgi:hypothetical protein
VLDAQVPFQFDMAEDYHPQQNARGTLIFLLKGETAAAATRYYDVYFDIEGSFVTPIFAPRVQLTEGIVDEGFDSYRIVTDGGKYFYHTAGGGFSSLDDQGNFDWINWKNRPAAAGDFRGIPNLVHPDDGGYFHPGRTTAASEIIHQGPLKATFKSTTLDGLWETRWEIFPTYARMTVLKANALYWFQYEGTPGGILEGDQDFVVRSDSTQTLASSSWTGDLAGEEWAYFADPALGRAIYLLHLTEDAIVDSYAPSLGGEMTIFGFGRDVNNRFLSQVPDQFIVGLVDSTIFAEVAAVIHAAYKPLAASVGAAEEQNPPTPTPTVTSTVLPTPTASPTMPSTPVPTVSPTATLIPAVSPTPTLSPTATTTPAPNNDNYLPLLVGG